MAIPRGNHAATLLPNGQVLLTGNGGGFSDAELYDPVTGIFTTSFSGIELLFAATLLPDGRVLVTGWGWTGTVYFGMGKLYNPYPATDSSAPTTATVTINSNATSTSSTDVILNLTATDNAGVVAYFASEMPNTPIPQAEYWMPITSSTIYIGNVPFRLSSSGGTKAVYVWFKDVAGNISSVASDTIDSIPDITPPTTTASPGGGAYASTQTVTLTCADGNTGCAVTYYTTNGTTPTTLSPAYSGPIPVSANTILRFFSRDNAGNNEAVQTQVYVIDTIAPTTTASPAGGTYTSARSVTLICADTSSGCAATYYTTDGTMPTVGSSVYTGPITISANTTLRFFSRDNAGNSGAVQTQVYVIDALPPTTTASPAGGAYAAAQIVTLACADSNTGCLATYYTTNGTIPTTLSSVYSGPITISVNTALRFFSRDAAGNNEVVQTQTYMIDTIAPVTTASPGGGAYASAQSVTLTCSDSNSGCAATYYTTNGTTPTVTSPTYAGPITISANTTLRFFSRDNAGNSGAVQTQIYAIDSGAPTTTASPAGGTYASAQVVTLACVDSNPGCAATYYTTNGTTPTTLSPVYTGPITISTNTTLRFFSRDTAGNTEAVQTQAYVIDASAPTTTASPTGGTYTSAQSVGLLCADSNSGCVATYYTTDGTTPTVASPVYTGPITISANTTLRFFSRDNAGNSGAVQTQTYVIDASAPTTTASPSSGTYTSTQVVTLACADSNSGCAATYYTTNGTTPTTTSTIYTGPITIGANTTLRFFSRDVAGNAEAVQTQTYTFVRTLTVSKAGSGGGAITSAPAGISCGGDCTEPYADALSVTLTAAADVGSIFMGWSGVCSGIGTCTLSMTTDRVVTATFTLEPTASTSSVTKVTATSATITGIANANGTVGAAWFEYGPTTAYGINTISRSISGSADITLTQEVNGLAQGTSYHYRLCAQVSGYIVCGSDASFTTRSSTLGGDGNISLVIPATVARVDGYDLIGLGLAFGADAAMPNWNPLADLNGDGIVDGRDLTILAINFGRVQ